MGVSLNLVLGVACVALWTASIGFGVAADCQNRGSLVRHTDEELARMTRYEGCSTLCIILSAVAGGYLLWRQSQTG